MDRFKIKLVDKYIFNQLLIATIAGVLLFIVVWISPEILFRIIRQAVYGEITPNVALSLFFLEIPEILGKAIPVGLLLGGIYVFDKLSRNFELIIFRNAGISFLRLIMPVAILGIISSFVCFYTYDNFIPYSTNQIKVIKNQVSNTQFVYLEKDSSGKPKQAVIVANYDGENIHNVNVLQFAQNINDDTPLMNNIISADEAEYIDGDWVLGSSSIYEISGKGIYKDIKNVDNIKILSGENAEKAYKLMNYATKRPREFKIDELKSYLTLLKSEDLLDEFRLILNKLYQRYAQAFSCVILAITGVVLGWSKPRQNRFLGFTIGAGIIFAYYLIIPFLDLVAEKGIIPPLLTAWLPCILIALGMIFYTKSKDL